VHTYNPRYSGGGAFESSPRKVSMTLSQGQNTNKRGIAQRVENV
jgi:hypothetical protein